MRPKNPYKTSHNGKQTRLYRIWHNIKQRCTNPKSHNFYRYGGRGISLCGEWMCFEGFCEWAIANGYSDSLSIDRIDNDLGYYPENCRWVDSSTQMNNTRRNVYVTYKGERLTIAQLAKKYNLKYSTLQSRISGLKYPVDKAVETPMRGTWDGSGN